jgi:hypothetical protein
VNRLQQICAEIIRLYRKQLNLWVLGKLANLPDPDVFEYKERQERIKELCAEMKQLQAKGVGINQNLCAILPKCDQQKPGGDFPNTPDSLDDNPAHFEDRVYPRLDK